MENLKILDKYIAKQLIDTFLLGIVIFTAIMFASDTFLSLIKQMSEYGISFKVAVLLIILNLPYIVVFTIPMAVLLATILTFNKLSTNSEISVMRACGISIGRLAMPVLVFGIVAAFSSFIINDYVVPAANLQAKNLTLWALTQKNVPRGKTNFSFKEFNDNKLKRLFYIDNCKKKLFEGVTVLDMSRPGSIQIIQAKYGRSKPEYWQVLQGSAYTISQNGKVLNTASFNKLNLPTDFKPKKQMRKAKELSFIRLSKYINKQKEKGVKDLSDLIIDLNEKLALPITSIIVALIGVPLALTPPRARFNRGLIFSIFLIFCYYMLRAFSISLGEAEKLPPVLAAWLPNIIMATIGGTLLYRKVYKI
jgi:lipopolysaccharide export system permease protein